MIAITLNAGMSKNGNSRVAYLVLDDEGRVIDCVPDTGRGSDTLEEKYPGLWARTRINVPAKELRDWVKNK